jgi:hypothetical protein
VVVPVLAEILSLFDVPMLTFDLLAPLVKLLSPTLRKLKEQAFHISLTWLPTLDVLVMDLEHLFFVAVSCPDSSFLERVQLQAEELVNARYSELVLNSQGCWVDPRRNHPVKVGRLTLQGLDVVCSHLCFNLLLFSG